jgi:hypothetical protein
MDTFCKKCFKPHVMLHYNTIKSDLLNEENNIGMWL